MILITFFQIFPFRLMCAIGQVLCLPKVKSLEGDSQSSRMAFTKLQVPPSVSLSFKVPFFSTTEKMTFCLRRKFPGRRDTWGLYWYAANVASFFLREEPEYICLCDGGVGTGVKSWSWLRGDSGQGLQKAMQWCWGVCEDGHGNICKTLLYFLVEGVSLVVVSVNLTLRL